jgi:hypothetical protein
VVAGKSGKRKARQHGVVLVVEGREVRRAGEDFYIRSGQRCIVAVSDHPEVIQDIDAISLASVGSYSTAGKERSDKPLPPVIRGW